MQLARREDCETNGFSTLLVYKSGEGGEGGEGGGGYGEFHEGATVFHYLLHT